ncbi:MAG: Fic family protein [Thiothrix sp.]|uniref:Fic family protein n=1 Tax=Thiothrix sp. TaxID=1032 RepID=UPI002630D7C3|nr:Fic family protein [Thiothrix sp.]MDD5393505.1 Fic family protein [Thiothrix sp.]
MQTISLAALLPQLETSGILKALIVAHRYLAELKGIAKTMPNQAILLSTLSLQEAQDSSEIENIITTQDALFKYRLQADVHDVAAKEVSNYADGLSVGYQRVREHGLLTLNSILAIQETLESNRAGFRKVPGTVLRNDKTGQVVYEPPSPEQIPSLMGNLEQILHDGCVQLDPLVRMAIIHHQFETIHPFYDGNGRTGRIINILYLVKEGLLDAPVLYLSRYINHTKTDYYRLLQEVRDTGNWENWVIYIVRGVGLTAKHTITLIEGIRRLLQQQKHHIRDNHRFYSQDLINNIFRHPYTKVQFLEHDLNVSRATATRYLDALAVDGVLEKHRLGRENYYLNKALVDLLFNIPKIETA